MPYINGQLIGPPHFGRRLRDLIDHQTVDWHRVLGKPDHLDTKI
jgi:hypothetical protein